jgi:hypothetical protein
MSGTQGAGPRQAQAPQLEQMPDSEVDAGKSDSEDGAGGLESDSGGFISKNLSYIISKKLSNYIHLYPKLYFLSLDHTDLMGVLTVKAMNKTEKIKL